VAKTGRRSKSALDVTAAGIGRTLGKLSVRLDAWRKQKQEITRDLEQVLTASKEMLAELGHDAGFGSKLGEIAKIQPARHGRGRPNERLKNESRAAWAKRRVELEGAVSKVRRTMSPEARARIAAAQRKRWAAKKASER
jgi:hypothetical protein